MVALDAPGTKTWVRIGTLESLAASARHHITLREKATGEYHALLLFSFDARNAQAAAENDADVTDGKRFYCMEANCPHLGAPLENATLEQQEDEEDEIEDMVVVCPWHEYDFSLRTGESSHGVQACVYAVDQRPESSGATVVWVEAPASSAAPADPAAPWELVEVRPVSEAFSLQNQSRAQAVAAAADSRAGANGTAASTDLGVGQLSLDESRPSAAASSSVPPPEPAPKTLVEWACLILSTPEPRKKVAYTRMATAAFRSGKVKLVGGGYARSCDAQPGDRAEGERYTWTRSQRETPPEVPPRLPDAVIVHPADIGKRGKGGTVKSRIGLLHSLANIEQWAIDLAWDIIARGPELAYKELPGGGSARKLPVQFYSDFMKVAEDEAKHFSLLTERIEELGSHFGALPVHHGLWKSAEATMHSLPARLSVIHLVHEARGLDVNPTTIQKFRNAKDIESVEILTTIHLDEVTHVSCGHRWLTWLCAHSEPPRDPVAVFREEVRQNFIGKLKGPFNAADRERAGLSREWYDGLEGQKPGLRPIGVQRAEVAGG